MRVRLKNTQIDAFLLTEPMTVGGVTEKRNGHVGDYLVIGPGITTSFLSKPSFDARFEIIDESEPESCPAATPPSRRTASKVPAAAPPPSDRAEKQEATRTAPAPTPVKAAETHPRVSSVPPAGAALLPHDPPEQPGQPRISIAEAVRQSLHDGPKTLQEAKEFCLKLGVHIDSAGVSMRLSQMRNATPALAHKRDEDGRWELTNSGLLAIKKASAA